MHRNQLSRRAMPVVRAHALQSEQGGFMHRALMRVCSLMIAATALLENAGAQSPLTWQEVRAKFEVVNPTLQAGQIGVDESRAQEITAYLRPNPTVGLLADQIDPFNGGPPHGTFAYLLSVASINYLHERQHKRELRLESAQNATKIAVSSQADLERTMLFDSAHGLRADASGKGRSEPGERKPRLLRPPAGCESRPLQAGRDCAGRPGPPRIAAGAVRIRLANGRGQSANGEDSAAGAAE